MFTVITRTSGRPKFFRRCRHSVLEQTKQAFHIIISDDPKDDYLDGDLILRVPHRAEHRGHNLYFNDAVAHIPPLFPWVIFLDDDDRFFCPDALHTLALAISSNEDLLLWQVQFPDYLIPGSALGRVPQMGNISGIGACFHRKHWVDWIGEPCADFFVINELYSRLRPVWIDEVLTGLQGGVGGGQRIDL